MSNIITEAEAQELERELRDLLSRFEAAEIEEQAITICSEQERIWKLQKIGTSLTTQNTAAEANSKGLPNIIHADPAEI